MTEEETKAKAEAERLLVDRLTMLDRQKREIALLKNKHRLERKPVNAEIAKALRAVAAAAREAIKADMVREERTMKNRKD